MINLSVFSSYNIEYGANLWTSEHQNWCKGTKIWHFQHRSYLFICLFIYTVCIYIFFLCVSFVFIHLFIIYLFHPLYTGLSLHYKYCFPREPCWHEYLTSKFMQSNQSNKREILCTSHYKLAVLFCPSWKYLKVFTVGYGNILRWKSEGRYHCTKSMAIAPFWFSADNTFSLPLIGVQAMKLSNEVTGCVR